MELYAISPSYTEDLHKEFVLRRNTLTTNVISISITNNNNNSRQTNRESDAKTCPALATSIGSGFGQQSTVVFLDATAHGRVRVPWLCS